MNKVRKLNFEAEKLNLLKQMSDNPKTLRGRVDYSNDKRISTELDNVVEFYKKNSISTYAHRRRIKDMIIYAVIHGGVYNRKVCDGFYVKVEQIESVYNKYEYYYEFVYQQPDFEKFKHYLFQEAKKAYQIEQKLCCDFDKNASAMEKMTGVAPIYWLYDEISKSTLTISNVKRQLEDLVEDFANEYISSNDYSLKNDILSSKLNVETGVLRTLNQRLEGKRPKGEKSRLFLIKLFLLKEVQDECIMSPSKIKIGSASTAEMLCKKYCSWYNKVENFMAIKMFQSEERKAKQKIAYRSNNSDKQAQKLSAKIALQTEVQCLLLKGKSLREIARQTGKGYGTIVRVSKDIKSLIEHQVA